MRSSSSYSHTRRKGYVNMSRRILLFMTVVGTIALAECCQDWDPSACALLAQSHKDLCADSTFANNTCVRFCGNCPLDCFSCPTPVMSPDDCNTTLTCALGEVCMTKQLKASDGHSEYIMTCEHRSICDGSNFGFGPQALLGKRQAMFDEETENGLEIHARQDRSVSIDCCDTDLCNMPISMTTTTTTTTENPTLAPTPRTTKRPAPISIHSTMGHIPTTSIYSNCNRDVAFLVDSSGSVGSANFNTALGFIKGVVAGLPIGPMGTLTSLMTFSTTPNINWYFNQLTSKQETTNALASVSYHSGGTRTDLALHSASTQLFTPEHGDRTHANNVVIVLTDGKSNMPSETVKQANALHIISHDVITVFVGTGPDMHELQTIATDQHHVFTVHDFHLLSSLQYQIHQLICSG